MTYNSQKASLIANQLNHLHLIQCYFVAHGYHATLDAYSDGFGPQLTIFYHEPKLVIPHHFLCSGIDVQFRQVYDHDGLTQWATIQSTCFPSLTDEE